MGEAIRVLGERVKPRVRTETVDVREASGRVLARDVVARQDVPPRDVSHFDGFAVMAADVAAAPVTLDLSDGRNSSLAPGHAHRVVTGGALPRGADAVVPVEETTVEGGRVLVRKAVPRGEYVYPAGRDVKRGETVLRARRVLGPQDVVLLASLKVARVPVAARPRVAIVPTGSELTDRIAGEAGKKFESHSILIGRLVEQAGGVPLRLPVVPDDKKAIARAIAKALGTAEIVITMAGTAAGEPDLVHGAIDSAGRPGVLVHGVKVHRGRVMGFGVVSGKPVVMAPGPVQAALNSFILFGYPLVRAHLGLGLEAPPSIAATVSDDWEAPARFKDFLLIVYVGLRSTEEGLVATPSYGETEKMSFLVAQDAYIRVPEGRGGLRRGERVRVELLPGFWRLG